MGNIKKETVNRNFEEAYIFNLIGKDFTIKYLQEHLIHSRTKENHAERVNRKYENDTSPNRGYQ
jgi:hypothetical protein